MSIRTKVIGSFLVILFLFFAASLFNYSRFRKANARLYLVSELYLPFSRSIEQLQGNIFTVVEDMRLYYFHSDYGAEAANFSRMVHDVYPFMVSKRIAEVDQLLSKPEFRELKPTINDLQEAIEKVRTLFTRMVQSRDRGEFEGIYVELRSNLQDVSRIVDDDCQRITQAAQHEGRDSIVLSLALSSFVVIFGILTLLMSHRVLRPLPILIDSIKKIADGNFDQSLKVDASNTDEISILAREYNRMLAGLAIRDKKIHEQQSELLQTEKLAAIGQLSAEVVHEIRNPLNAISLNIDWLETQVGNRNSELSKTLSSIAREIQRLNQITESYLVRARVPSQQFSKIEVHDLLSEILSFSKEDDRARNITVQTEWAPQEIYIKADRSRLKQAFLNVLKNAKEAMPRGGRLMIRTEIRENVSRILFSDTGYGMNDSVKQHTFRPFYTTKQSGTGIGLMLTKNIVEEAQGSVDCESRMGEGTTFTFQFPV
jgi:two-component system, NtrC family, sensor kinase